MNEERILRAHTFLEADRPMDALRELSIFLASAPENAEALRLAAQAHLVGVSGREGAEAAIRFAKNSLRFEPQSSHAWRLVSIANNVLGAHDRARHAARSAVRLSPDSWECHICLANADMAADAVNSGTMRSITEALRLDPNEPDVLATAARLAVLTGDSAGGQRLYRQILQRNPDDIVARNNLALIEMSRGNNGSAAASLASILAANPRDETALHNLHAAVIRTVFTVPCILILPMTILFIRFAVFVPSRESSSDHVLIFILSTVMVLGFVGYLWWVRRTAGPRFWQIVRALPHTNRGVAVCAGLITLIVVTASVTNVMPLYAATLVYVASELILGFCVLVAILAASTIRNARIKARVAASAIPRLRPSLGKVAFWLAVACCVVLMAVSVATVISQNTNNRFPAISAVFDSGFVIGVWALVQGIVATAQNRGRTFGILAMVIVVITPVMSVATTFMTLIASGLLQR